MEVGAGTFHPSTFLRALGPEPWNACYVQASRRPGDGRYGDNPSRLQHYYQFQVVMKPAPADFLELYIGSLKALGLDLSVHDIRFVEDNWESPTLGASGLGWEVWLNGLEITQFTYFQRVGGLDCNPSMGEIAYGLERLSMYAQGVDQVRDLRWHETSAGAMTYGDLFLQGEREHSTYNFEYAQVEAWSRRFDDSEREAAELAARNLPLPAYERVLDCSHSFNMLEARGSLSTTLRQQYILRIRTQAAAVARAWLSAREAEGFPLLRPSPEPSPPPPIPEPSDRGGDGKRDLLIEIGCEELPQRQPQRLAAALAQRLAESLSSLGCPAVDWQLYSTPRRVAALAKGVAERTPEREEIRSGPLLTAARDQSGAWTPGALGFARSVGVAVDQLSIGDHDGRGERLLFRRQLPGRMTVELLPQAVAEALPKISPTAMHWGLGGGFLRPVRWLLLQYGSQALPLSAFSIDSGDGSRGHRVQAPNLPLKDAGDYEETLRKQGFVIADRGRRRLLIEEGVAAEAEKLGGRVEPDSALLEEITDLVEWPVVLSGRFAGDRLKLPAELLIAAMKKHQRFFPLIDDKGALMPAFIAVANLDSPSPQSIVEGYERVLRPRLDDADFFWSRDQKTGVAALGKKLAAVDFNEKLGSLADKTERLRALVAEFAADFTADAEVAATAALLCKADLTSETVGEFPQLQGVVGGRLLAEKGDEKAARAIAEHYWPRFAGDALPTTSEGQLLAFCDRLDEILCGFMIGFNPTGTRDPYGLRRAALGLARLLVEGGRPLAKKDVLERAAKIIAPALRQSAPKQKKKPLQLFSIQDFLESRLEHYFVADKGMPRWALRAVDAAREPPASFVDKGRRIQALKEMAAGPEAQDLATVHKRIANILRANPASGKFDPKRIESGAERALFEQVEKASEPLATAKRGGDYIEVFQQAAELRPLLAAFFDEVLVLCDDLALRNSRLALLNQVRLLFSDVAELSLMPVASGGEAPDRPAGKAGKRAMQ